jgi:hypothetical protein
MAQADWNAVFTGTSYFMIRTGSPPDGTKYINMIPQSGVHLALYFYKNKVDFANCRATFYALPAVSCSNQFFIRTNRSTGAGYYVQVSQSSGIQKTIMLNKQNAWRTGISTPYSGLRSSASGVWEKFRITIKDLSVPSWRIRFTLDIWSGGAWVNLTTWDDTSPTIVNGEMGFGSQGDAWTDHYFDKVELYEESP